MSGRWRFYSWSRGKHDIIPISAELMVTNNLEFINCDNEIVATENDS